MFLTSSLARACSAGMPGNKAMKTGYRLAGGNGLVSLIDVLLSEFLALMQRMDSILAEIATRPHVTYSDAWHLGLSCDELFQAAITIVFIMFHRFIVYFYVTFLNATSFDKSSLI